MSELNKTQLFVDRFLGSLERRGELLPRARQALLEHATGERPTALLNLVEYLKGSGRFHLTKKGQAAFEEQPLLRWMLDRLPLKPDAADRLYEENALNYARFQGQAGETAATVVGMMSRLGKDDHREFWRYPDPVPGFERAREAITAYESHLSSTVDIDELAEQWAGDLLPLSPTAAKAMVATRLTKVPHYYERLCLGGSPADLSPEEKNPRRERPSEAQVEEAKASGLYNW